jgi:hypothetical protein
LYAVILTRRKLRHYFESHPVTVVSSFPLGEIIQCREASGRIAKWAVEIMGETISFAPRKAIKSQVLADFVAEWVDTQLPMAPIQPELWTMFFDGSLMKTGAGAGLLFISPLGKHLRYVLRLHFPASNNVAEYEALINGLRIAIELGVRRLCHTRVWGHQDPGANIITRCAGTKSHTYDESWHRIECHIFTI